tara:strand:+ start:111 stop:881 length:771 start_codon:yes stop_codon:yes gene_type:complete
MTKYNSAYILSHNGLGDNITMIGAINYLLLHYNNVYLLCKDKYESNVKLLINNKNVIIIPFDHINEESSCKNIITNVYSNDYTDVFICGVHKNYLKSKITNPSILNYNKNNKYNIKWEHIKTFYQDMNLDLSIYYEYFDINSTEKSIALYEKIKDINIIFCHTQSSTKTISLSENIKTYINDNKYIIICANENVYNKNHAHFEVANKFINIPVAEYIDVIKNACEIFIIDSCFSCIINPLSELNKLNTKKIKYDLR